LERFTDNPLITGLALAVQSRAFFSKTGETMQELKTPAGFEEMMRFGLVEALLGRRSRRFFMGAEIPDGVFAYKSRHKALPLTDLEKMPVVSACGGNTSWHHMIYRAARYAPHLSNYARSAGGRVIPRLPGFIPARFSSRMTRGYMH
jgi:hypothetical protein